MRGALAAAAVVTLALGQAGLHAAVFGEDAASPGALAGVYCALTGCTVRGNAIGADTRDGIVLRNTTAAVPGGQQNSPRLRWSGSGWKTSPSAASLDVDFWAEVVPVQGASAPTGAWRLWSSVGGGLPNEVLSISDLGVFRTNTNAVCAGVGGPLCFSDVNGQEFTTPVYLTNTFLRNPGIAVCNGLAPGSVCFDDVEGFTNANGPLTSTRYATRTNCIDNAGNAQCGSSAAGMVVIDAGDTTTVVNTTAVTAASEIVVFSAEYADARYDTISPITCNQSRTLFPDVSVSSAGQFTVRPFSFATGDPTAPTTNPLCVGFLVLN